MFVVGALGGSGDVCNVCGEGVLGRLSGVVCESELLPFGGNISLSGIGDVFKISSLWRSVVRAAVRSPRVMSEPDVPLVRGVGDGCLMCIACRAPFDGLYGEFRAKFCRALDEEDEFLTNSRAGLFGAE
jgi:hypothetical protein